MTKEGINSGKAIAHYAGINLVHNHPPESTPGDLHQNVAPTLGLLHPSFCIGGGGGGKEFVGIAPERRAFVYKQFLPFLEFPL